MGADIDKVRFAPFGLVPWLLHAKINSLTDMPVPLGSSGDTAATAAAAETRAPLALLNDFVFTKDGTKISPIMGHAVFCFGANADAVALRAVVGGATTAVGSLGTFFFFFRRWSPSALEAFRSTAVRADFCVHPLYPLLLPSLYTLCRCSVLWGVRFLQCDLSI